VSQSKYCSENLDSAVDDVLSRHIVDSGVRRAQFGSECQGLADRKVRKVDVYFPIIGDLAAEARVHYLRRNPIIMDIYKVINKLCGQAYFQRYRRIPWSLLRLF
jgi:hypothetical protein